MSMHFQFKSIPTVNVLSESLVLMRILLGALFALMLALPFGLESFNIIAKHLISIKNPVTIQQGSLHCYYLLFLDLQRLPIR